MMVPMMLPADGSSPYGGAASMSMMNPFMMPQPFMMPPMTQGPPSTGPQQVQQASLPQPQFSGFTMPPQASSSQQSQPTSSSSLPASTHASSNNHGGSSQTQPQGSSTQSQFVQGAQPVPIMPAGGFPTSAVATTTPGFPAIAPNPMSFFMPQQSFMNGNPMQMITAAAAPSTALPTVGDSSNTTDSQTNLSTSNNSAESKSPPPGQQGVQGGSNLAHCA